MLFLYCMCVLVLGWFGWHTIKEATLFFLLLCFLFSATSVCLLPLPPLPHALPYTTLRTGMSNREGDTLKDVAMRVILRFPGKALTAVAVERTDAVLPVSKE